MFDDIKKFRYFSIVENELRDSMVNDLGDGLIVMLILLWDKELQVGNVRVDGETFQVKEVS